MVRVLTKGTMLTGGFFVLLLLRVVFLYGLPGCPCLHFYRFPQVPVGPWVRSGGGAVVVRGHPGGIPGFPIEIWTLGYNRYCALVAGKPVVFLSCVCLSLVSVFWYSKQTYAPLTSRRLGWLTRSSGTAICWPRAWSSEAYHKRHLQHALETWRKRCCGQAQSAYEYRRVGFRLVEPKKTKNVTIFHGC